MNYIERRDTVTFAQHFGIWDGLVSLSWMSPNRLLPHHQIRHNIQKGGKRPVLCCLPFKWESLPCTKVAFSGATRSTSRFNPPEKLSHDQQQQQRISMQNIENWTIEWIRMISYIGDWQSRAGLRLFFSFLRCMSRDKVREEEKGGGDIESSSYSRSESGCTWYRGECCAKFPSLAI